MFNEENMATEDLRMRSTTAVEMSDLPGTIHTFNPPQSNSILKTFGKELGSIISEKRAKTVLAFGLLNIIGTTILLFWCASTNSMALTAYTYLTIFDLFSLITCLVTVWVKKQKPSPLYSFGYTRFEVLAVFASTVLAILGALFIMKESVERMFLQPDIITGRLMFGMVVAFALHMILAYTADNEAFKHVIAASSSSWLQEHVSDISESVCRIVPGLSKLLLPRINPFALIGCAGAAALIFAYMLIDIRSYHAADTWTAVWIALMTIGTMFPMSVYTGKILLQTTPGHIIGQLDKCIREASTLDGVLEFRHEHFWTLSFGSMCGSVHVRIRRDADEQMVLAHVFHRLSNLVSGLTVQIFKDDWSRPSTFQVLGDTNLFTSKQSTTQQISSAASTPYSSPYSTLKTSTVPASIPNVNKYSPSIGTAASNVPQQTINSAFINPSHLNRDILKLLGSNEGLNEGGGIAQSVGKYTGFKTIDTSSTGNPYTGPMPGFQTNGTVGSIGIASGTSKHE